MKTFRVLPLAALLVSVPFAVACSDDPAPDPTGTGGAGGEAPTSTATTTTSTTGSTGVGGAGQGGAGHGGAGHGGAGQGGSGQGGGAAAGFGEISGDCGVITAGDTTGAESKLFRNALDFGEAAFDSSKLTPGGLQVFQAGDANSTATYSETFAFEVLARCEGAELLKTGDAIAYKDAAGKKTDMLVQIHSGKLGVNVARAFIGPTGDTYSVAQAKDMLEKQLAAIAASTANVDTADAFPKQILHVMAYAPLHADSVEAAYTEIDAQTKGNTLVYVTVTEGNDDYLYKSQ